MAGAVWQQLTGDITATNQAGTQAGFDAAKAAAAAAGGGLSIGPGMEAVSLGLFASNVWFVRRTNTGLYGIGRFHILDGRDPTKELFFDVDSISPGVQRTVQVLDYNGFLIVPLTEGVSGQFLKSNGVGVQPTWAAVAVTNALLDGANHTDTVAQAVLRGALVVGNSTPKWDRLPIGAADTVLTSNGTDPAWSANPAVQHDTLNHLKPFQVAGNVRINNGSAVLTDSSGTNRFANVRVGDRINLDSANYVTSLYGFRATTSGLSDPNNITMDTANASGGDVIGATAIVHPGDHFDNTLIEGLLSTGGWGTFNTGGGAGSGTLPTIVGSALFRGYASGATPKWDYLGSSSTANPWGFCISKSGTSNKTFFYSNDLTGIRYVKLANLDGTMCLTEAVQNISEKHFQTNCVVECQRSVGAGNGTVFSDTSDNTKQLLFDVSNIATTTAAGKIAKWQDLSAGGFVDYTYLARVTGIDGKTIATTNLYTVPSGKSVIVTRVVVRCTAATAITIWPTYGVGVAAGEDDIIASTAHAIAGAADTFILQIPKDGAVVATSTQVIKLGIDAGATGTSMTLAVDIAGYLV